MISTRKTARRPSNTRRTPAHSIFLRSAKDKKRLLVVELKKGKASDAVVGQTLRYMGFVQEALAEKDQTVQGMIIALEDDQRIRRARAMTSNIRFCRYQISFKL